MTDSKIKKYIGFLILIIPTIFLTAMIELCILTLIIIGFPLFIGAMLIGWVEVENLKEFLLSPFEILKDLLEQIED